MKARHPVEIYFVLYISAMLLLLTEPSSEVLSDEQGEFLTALYDNDFFLRAENNVMTVQFRPSVDSMEVVLADTLNRILYFGNVTDVQYTVQIEDMSFRTSVAVNQKSENPEVGTFTIDTVGQSGTLLFRWKPSKARQVVSQYRVTVKATALPEIPTKLRDEDSQRQFEEFLERTGTRLEAETTFSLQTVNIDAVIADAGDLQNGRRANPTEGDAINTNDTSALQGDRFADSRTSESGQLNHPDQRRPSSSSFGARPTLQPLHPTIETISRQQWENVFTVWGVKDITQEFSSAPTIAMFSDEANVAKPQILSVQGREIRVRGTSPYKGLQTVRLSLTANDGSVLIGECKIRATELLSPQLPDTMFAEQVYRIDPKLPILRGQDVRAEFVDAKTKAQRMVSQEGEPFTFAPKQVDIGNAFRLVRYVGSMEVSRSVAIPVITLPSPLVFDVQQQSDKQLRVVIHSFGTIDRRENRVRLKVQGNAQTPKPLYAEYVFDESNNAHIQTFIIARKDKNTPFHVEIIAEDIRGVKSKTYNWTE
jgi:hypothetical protein